MQKNPSIVDILWRYQQHETLTELDRRILEEWLRQSEANEDLFDDISNEEAWNRQLATLKSKDSKATWNLIRERIEAGGTKRVPVLFHWKKYAAIAAVFAGAVIGTFFLVIHRHSLMRDQDQPQVERFKNDVAPAVPKPTLTLANGTVIDLDTARTGNLTASNSIWKTDSNSLVIQQITKQADEELSTLTTPTGTSYQLTLADGSRVWLNAGSSLTFPESFTGKERKVILSGEGYFEITKNKDKPFLVDAGNGVVRVLGTEFNVRNYIDESSEKTTLVKGLISLRAGADSTMLRPGHQAILGRGGRIMIDSVNMQQAVAWRQNLFWFQDEPFDEIMNEIARWYPIHVTYKGPLTERFSGILPRSRSLIEVLKTLELEEYVHFRIQGNEVQVIPRKT
jgi:transmembrane sensor